MPIAVGNTTQEFPGTLFCCEIITCMATFMWEVSDSELAVVWELSI